MNEAGTGSPRQVRFYVALATLLVASTVVPLAGKWMKAAGLDAIPFILPMVLAMIWTGYEAARGAVGPESLAGPMRRYARRLTLSMTAYAVLLIAVISVFNRPTPPTGAAGVALAVLPALPILAIFWTIGRLLVETSDEYQRLQFTKDILIATAATLSLSTIWGFLENFGQVPHALGFHVAGLWFAMLFVSVMVRRLRG